ncbi:MAG: hypothetical protein GTO45_16795 [Candidatus Aminicenantes bacterium]|nr:hypothetical protein [Candidatus Aminicenantes bacterium]NIM80400.1 hypothetical protein [Candidatus Aminicenantes bacterium]NIN19787.1 hypothetical protein [Candidatus Aminicenantes bacterium]NIN43669.1 hypothetical protein [Candidatus Aminicenantes bacterium]NIN86414.1 hypothetical protein [Candidatus Aminicenantes bacterium]
MVLRGIGHIEIECRGSDTKVDNARNVAGVILRNKKNQGKKLPSKKSYVSSRGGSIMSDSSLFFILFFIFLKNYSVCVSSHCTWENVLTTGEMKRLKNHTIQRYFFLLKIG